MVATLCLIARIFDDGHRLGHNGLQRLHSLLRNRLIGRPNACCTGLRHASRHHCQTSDFSCRRRRFKRPCRTCIGQPSQVLQPSVRYHPHSQSHRAHGTSMFAVPAGADCLAPLSEPEAARSSAPSALPSLLSVGLAAACPGQTSAEQ